MRRTLIAMAISVIVASCGRDGGVIGATSLPNIRGQFVVEDDSRATPLTSAQHSIYYVLGNQRKLVFQGSGAPAPTLSLLTADDILVRYCGGRVEKFETSFFEDESNVGKVDRELRILRLQPVTSPGLTANGKAICSNRAPQN